MNLIQNFQIRLNSDFHQEVYGVNLEVRLLPWLDLTCFLGVLQSAPPILYMGAIFGYHLTSSTLTLTTGNVVFPFA